MPTNIMVRVVSSASDKVFGRQVSDERPNDLQYLALFGDDDDALIFTEVPKIVQ